MCHLPSFPRCFRAVLAVLLFGSLPFMHGCKDEAPPGRTKKAVPDVSLLENTVFVFELDTVTIEKLVGGADSKREFNHFLHKNLLYVVSRPGSKHTFRIGLTAPAASYGISQYPKVRGRSDHLFVRLPPFKTGLIKDDGTHFEMSFNDLRFEAIDTPDENGVIHEVKAHARGSYSITHGDTRFSGGFDAVWRGKPDELPPEVTVVPPAHGLVSGAFDIHFDKPVEVGQVANRVFLRNAKGEELKIRIEPLETDFRYHSTLLRVDTQNLLPFNEKLTLAVGTDFKDLAGRPLQRPYVEVVSTPDIPPELQQKTHDFSESRGTSEFHLQGDAKIVKKHRGVLPFSGRLLVLNPPSAGNRFTSALTTSLTIPHDAEWLQVYVRKTALTRDQHTPCLRYTLAQASGLIWNVECGPPQVPSMILDSDEGEIFVTQWLPLNIHVTGQRGQQVVMLLEAEPLKPDMPVSSKPSFVVDRIRLVKTGEDPMVLDY